MVKKAFVILAILAIASMYAQAQVLTDGTSAVGISNTGPCQGGAWGDYDGDGDEDFALAIDQPFVGVGGVRIFKNNGGTFTEVTDAIPTTICDEANTVCWFDYDKDNDLDLIIGALGTDGFIFRNDGSDTFSDQTSALGIASDTELSNKLAISIADYDNDGYPDIFAGVFSTVAGNNYILKNVSGSSFTDVTPSFLASMLVSPRASTAFDFNEDGLMDIYVGGDSGTNKLLRNDGSMSFTDVTATPINVGAYTAGICVADFDLDGDLDMCASKHLYQNDSPGGTSSWVDVTFSALSSITPSVISPVPFDYNNDGKVDIFVGELGAAGLPSHIFRNDGAMTFTDVTLTDAPHMSTTGADVRGAAVADIDNDGDLELYRSHSGGGMWIYLNNTNDNNWLKVKVVGVSSPTSGIGAKVKVYQAGTSTLLGYSQVLGQSGYESQNSLIQHFGVPSAGQYDVEVTFPSGTVQTQTSVNATQKLEIWETGAPPTATPPPLGVTTGWELYY